MTFYDICSWLKTVTNCYAAINKKKENFAHNANIVNIWKNLEKGKMYLIYILWEKKVRYS